jgi:uncharacterized XkdX family phage protein
MTYPDFSAIKYFYGLKLWTDDMVGQAVNFKAITADQYKELTGKDYAAATSEAPAVTSAASDSSAPAAS